MEIVVEEKNSLATGHFGGLAARVSLLLEGRKAWVAHNKLRFETSAYNVQAMTELFPAAAVVERRGGKDAASHPDLAKSAREAAVAPAFRLLPTREQLESFERFKDRPQWALFSEQGTGKTKVACDIICHRYLNGSVTGVMILSNPKGVHAQWVEDQMPKHMWEHVPMLAHVWDGDLRRVPDWVGSNSDELQVFSGNIDMVKSKGKFALLRFAKAHKGKLLILVDESDCIKNLSSMRSKELRKLATFTQQRAIMTGTPIAKDLTDEWAQFYFLNPDIIGHKYLTTFRATYCVMGGFEGRAVVGHKNVDHFKQLTAPFIYRATKADLGLPPKIYDEVVFDMSNEQKRLIKELKENFWTQLDNGEITSVSHAAVALLRIQQISNGFVTDENNKLHRIDNPRLDALLDLRRQIQGKVIIWCRFREDVHLLHENMPNATIWYGGLTDEQKSRTKARFIEGDANEIIATSGAMGRGIDGLQSVCSVGIYYSNTFNAIDRWQSEDRIDRIGMRGSSRHFDLIARGSPDRHIIRNLKAKKDISSLALDDIKRIMEQL